MLFLDTSCCLAGYGEIERREEKHAFCTLSNFFFEVSDNTSMTVTSGLRKCVEPSQQTSQQAERYSG